MRACVFIFILGSVLASEREGRIFGSSFWRNLEKGLDQVAGDIEVAVDQLGTSLRQLRRPSRHAFADKIDEQVDDALPPWLRKTDSNQEIEVIEGSFGSGGVDDGLTVTYGNGEEVKVSIPESSGSNSSLTAEVQDVSNGETTEIHFDTSKPKPIIHSFINNFFKPFNLRGSIGGSPTYKPWWEGANVCTYREEVDEGTPPEEGDNVSFFFLKTETSICSEDDGVYKCTTTTSNRGMKKTLTITRRCCHGYAKTQNGCEKVEQRTITELMDKLGTNYFMDFLTTSDLNEVINEKNFTVFVPSNEAVQDYTTELEIEDEVNALIEIELETLEKNSKMSDNIYRVKRSELTSDLVKAHVVDGLMYAADFKDEQILKSNLDGSTVRINMYAGYPTVVTANCARLVTMNQRATNGVIHTIDRVLNPVTMSIMETIENNPEFTIFNKLLNKPSVASVLEGLSSDGQLTLLAPTDDAFKTIPEASLVAIIEGDVCIDSIIKNHILPNVICSAALGPESRTVNLLNEYLTITRDENDKIQFEDAIVLEKDIMATNGVIYAINKPLIPSAAKPLLDVLTEKNLTRFLELLEKAEMMDEIPMMSGVTVFAPSNNAIEQLEEDILNDLQNDQEALREMLRYHFVTSSFSSEDINNNHMIDTQNGQPVRINLYSTYPLLGPSIGRHPVRVTAGCSQVSEMDNRACGSMVHIIEEVLSIPQKDVMTQLENDEDFSIFTQILKDTGLDEDLSKEKEAFTVLAPSDFVFKALPEDELKMIQESEEMKQTLAKKHILREHLCCSGINRNTWLFMDNKRSLDGSSLHVRKNHHGRLMAGPARITECGTPSNNGVIHTVNHLLHDVRPQNPYTRTRLTPGNIFGMPGIYYNL